MFRTIQIHLTAFILIFHMTSIHAQNPESVVQSNLNAYNNRNLEVFMSYFTDDIVLVNFSDQKTVAEGKTAIENLYRNLFEQSPKLHSTILKRMVLGNKVIDHESITGRKGSAEAVELIMIYEVKEDKIFRMTVIRPTH